jgi:hypothetical protein
MHGRRWGWVLMSGLCLVGAAAFAGEPAGQLELATQRVVVFKDGNALVVKEGRGRAGPDGTLTTDQGPTQAVLGTFWIFDLDGAPLASVGVERRSRQERRQGRGTCRSIIEVVKANLGKTARVSREKGEDLEGKLLRVLESPPAQAAAERADRPAPTAPGRPARSRPRRWTPRPGGPTRASSSCCAPPRATCCSPPRT